MCFLLLSQQLYYRMFNPQRKSKLADIYMEERSFQLHLEKMKKIKQNSPRSIKLQEEQQKKYLQKLHMSKQQVKERLNSQVYRQNHRLFVRLMETDSRPQFNPETSREQKHFNGYFSNRKQSQRINKDNRGIIERVLSQASSVPPLAQLKQQYKQSKRYSKMVRKLPAILKHQQEIRKDLSMRRLNHSKVSLATSRNGLSKRASTQLAKDRLEDIEKTLVEKE